MDTQKIKNTIISLFKEKENFKEVGLDDDYFDLGVSSLTIVELQIKVEEVLGFTIETRELMRFSSINEWINAYTTKSEGIAVA